MIYTKTVAGSLLKRLFPSTDQATHATVSNQSKARENGESNYGTHVEDARKEYLIGGQYLILLTSIPIPFTDQNLQREQNPQPQKHQLRKSNVL